MTGGYRYFACERETAIHSAAILNQKNRVPAFWMTGDTELQSWRNSNDTLSLRLLQHQGMVEPHRIALKTLFPVTIGTLFTTPMRLALERRA